MEKLDLSLLPKDTLKKFKNALKIVCKDKEPLYPPITGVYFCNDKKVGVKYLMGSDGKNAIIYKDVDFPIEFEGKSVNKNGEIVADTYPALEVPKDLDSGVIFKMDTLNEYYNVINEFVKENKYTQAKVHKEKKHILVPIHEDISIDYFFYKNFIKVLELANTTRLLYSSDKKYICTCFNDDKSVIGVILNHKALNSTNIAEK